MLGIKTKLLTVFHPQTDDQMERMNQELKINNKVYLTTKMSPFIVNYGRELRIGMDLRRKENMKKTIVFIERMRKVQKETGIVLARTQEEMER